jgi:hypothetical protein
VGCGSVKVGTAQIKTAAGTDEFAVLLFELGGTVRTSTRNGGRGWLPLRFVRLGGRVWARIHREHGSTWQNEAQ